jgi:hypothetical protein
MSGVLMSNVSNQSLGNTGLGNLSFTPQHLARYYFIMNTSTLDMDEHRSNGARFELFPNPSSGLLKLKSSSDADSVHVSIFSDQGAKVLSSRIALQNGEGRIDECSTLPNGTYLLIIGDHQLPFVIAR